MFLKYSFVFIFIFLQLQNDVYAQNIDSFSNLDTVIESYLELLESGEKLSLEQYKDLGEAHYRRGAMYKSIYFFSLDAALETSDNLKSNGEAAIDQEVIDSIKLRKENFLNNSDNIEKILKFYENTDLFEPWKNELSENTTIISKEQIVANWYRKNQDALNCDRVDDSNLKSFCEYFFMENLSITNYTRLQRNIGGEIPTNRDLLIDISYDRLIEMVDYYHAQWVQDFSFSYMFLKRVENPRYVDALFQKRDWETVSNIASNFQNEPIQILADLADDFQTASLKTTGTIEKIAPIESMISSNYLGKLNFIIIHLTEGGSSKIIRDHLIKENYPEKLRRSRDNSQDDRVPRILLRIGLANSYPRLMAIYLPQSNSKRPEMYGAHRMVISSHHNFLNRGIGGENQAKSQLVELQKEYDNISLLHFLIQLATKPRMSNNNNTILTN